MFTQSTMASGPGVTDNILVFIIIAVVLICGLKLAGRVINKWAEFCSERIKNTKVCTGVIFSPPVAVAAIVAYNITAQANYHIAGYPFLTFLVWFAPIAMGTVFWFGMASAIASE